ncbi:spermatogenesis-associated protein 7 isoform X5 [Phyllopteryx taeniolatus]|nr:spermatogenesis-associated protein 7 isoform X5 [Phyllopteryx taeniolatus]XP_061652138.1 spermatogenesis-associated protein 7 isoform X5 [Phyllopteryx taeniolatus]XP_061652140.1 spermatogenesis-associated protein 7 isoform X5 [Phyllopteryx taeniolatus]XP_061652141.1 spermatogenesis-associated protein 7 isoform X5 [Phyllopteryx taeniolatus]XP_061652142.1 spermatogenesis-associated protein 7 isoform X5 [Phyllopteryx taeniolatus]XP_061652143.1 spermatogenesis-associated protein 7 isoform X5 [P
MIKDHMVSHYKRIYSAKAVIDTSVPKSLTQSVRYLDRMKQERMKKGSRPQSAPSLSHRNSRASCYSAQSRCSVQSEYAPYLCSRNSMLSAPGFSSSFHAKEVPSPSTKAAPQNQHHHRPHSVAELKFRSQEPTSHGWPSACDPSTSGEPSFVKAFQDPVQKTYSGDLLQKHSQRFTQDKPFTPKMLKSEKSSYLSSYRYYRAPRGTKLAEECDDLRSEKGAKTMQHTQELYDPSQELNKEQQLAETEYTGTYLITPKQQTNKSRDCDPFDYSTSFSLEGLNVSPSAEDEELMYLEFISDVTEDILSRGSVSDRVLNRVIQRHIDMNLHRLDEAKMRHLLDILRNNLDEPSAPSSYGEDLGKKDLLDSLQVMPESALEQVKSEEDNNNFSYVSKRDNSPEHCLEPVLSSTPVWSPERSSPLTTNEKPQEEENNWEKGVSEHVSNNEGKDEEDDQPLVTKQPQADGEARHEEFLEDQAEVDVERQSKELEDLERRFSESLHVEQDTKDDNLDSSSEHQTNTLASVSDDGF